MITIEKKKGLGIISFDPKMSFLTFDIIDEFKTAFTVLADDDDIKIIIMYAENAIYGMSIPFIHSAIKSGNREEISKSLLGVHEFVSHMYVCTKPILGVALGTHLLGGGLELFLPCDHLLLAPHTMIGLPETNIGIIPDFGGTFISHLIGVRKAVEVILSGRMYDFEEACDLGLVTGLPPQSKKDISWFAKAILTGDIPQNRPEFTLVPEEAIISEEDLLKLAKGKSRYVIEMALGAIYTSSCSRDYMNNFTQERENFLNAVFSGEALIGVEAFLAKQKPRFTDAISG